MTVCVISQPRFFPGLHYLHRMMVADVFVIFDTVQYNPRHEENRAKLKTPNGPQWLTVPMRRTGRDQLISNTYIDKTKPWQQKAKRTIETLYRKSPNYEAHISAVTSVLETPYETLTELDRASWEPALRPLDITCQFVYASDLAVSGRGSDLLLEICKTVGADTYLSGAFGKTYLSLADFSTAGIEVAFHDYTYPVYDQRFGEFTPYLSYLDVLFNAGLDRETVLAGGDVAVLEPNL